MDRDNQNASEVLFKARIDDLFLLRTNLRSVGYSNWINYVNFRMMHPRKELRNNCGPRHDLAVIHGWTILKLEIGPITEKTAVIVVENLFRPLLISLSTLKRKSEIRVDYQRRCIYAGDSSVPLVEEICPPVGESRKRQIMAPSDYPRVPTGEVEGENFAPRSEWANKGRTFVWGSVCDEIVDIEIDNRTDCNMISEGLLESLGCEDVVRRCNGKLKGTFKGKEQKVEALGYIRTRVGFCSFEGTLMLIVVSNRILDSDVVLSAQGLAECHKLFVSNETRALCHESNLLHPTPVVFEKLPKTSMIMLDEETIVTKKRYRYGMRKNRRSRVRVWIANGPRRSNPIQRRRLTRDEVIMTIHRATECC